MHQIDPTTELLDMTTDEPLRTGVLSASARGELAKLHGEMLAAPPEKRPPAATSAATSSSGPRPKAPMAG